MFSLLLVVCCNLCRCIFVCVFMHRVGLRWCFSCVCYVLLVWFKVLFYDLFAVVFLVFFVVVL